MKNKTRKFLRTFVIAFLTLLFVSGQVSYASQVSDDSFVGDFDDVLLDITNISALPKPPEVSAESIILIEAKSGTILYEKDAYTAHFPASITKIMTALLTIENCSLDETVTFSYRATHELEEGSSGIARTEGEQMSVRECLYALLIASANEVAQALAEHVSGSIEAFAELMNKRAAELGCTGTHFANPSGLNNDNHYTTCHDMALIMAEAIKNPTFVEIDSTISHTVPATNKHSETLGIAMKHELLKGNTKYPYAKCGKTGYTDKAGFTLVTYAVKNDMDLICVTLNCSNSSQRSSSTKALFEYGFNNFSIYRINELNSFVLPDASDGTLLNKNLLSLSIPENSYMVLPRSYNINSITGQIEWGADSNSSRIAMICCMSGDDILGRTGLYINNSMGPYDFLGQSTAGEEQISDDTKADNFLSVIKIIVFILIFVVLVTIIGLLLYRFVNGKSVRKKRRVKVSRNLKRKIR